MICREGEFFKDRLPVLSNALNIPQRLKEIDRRFFVMLNRRTQRFEIHHSGQIDTTLACTLPYDALDGRALDYVRRYSASRAEETVREVDAHNERLEQTTMNDFMDKANYKMREGIRYVANTTKTDEIPKELIAE